LQPRLPPPLLLSGGRQMWVINHGVLINYNYAASNFIFSLSFLWGQLYTHTYTFIIIYYIYTYTTTNADGKSCEAAMVAVTAVRGPRNAAAAEACSLSLSLSLSRPQSFSRSLQRRRRRRRLIIRRLAAYGTYVYYINIYILASSTFLLSTGIVYRVIPTSTNNIFKYFGEFFFFQMKTIIFFYKLYLSTDYIIFIHIYKPKLFILT